MQSPSKSLIRFVSPRTPKNEPSLLGQALDLLPGNANVREWLADVKGVLGSGLLSLGRMVEAEPLLKEAVELDPTYSILWGYLSRWHFSTTRI